MELLAARGTAESESAPTRPFRFSLQCRINAFVVLRKFIDPCEPTEEYAHVEQFGVQESAFCQPTIKKIINL